MPTITYILGTLVLIRCIGLIVAAQFYLTHPKENHYALMAAGWLLYALAPLVGGFVPMPALLLALIYALLTALGAFLLATSLLCYFVPVPLVWVSAGALIHLLPLALFPFDRLQDFAVRLPLFLQSVVLLALLVIAIRVRARIMRVSGRYFFWLMALLIAGILHTLGNLFFYAGLPEDFPGLAMVLISALLVITYIHVEHQTKLNALSASQASLQSASKLFKTVLESLTYPFYIVNTRDYSVKIANPAARLDPEMMHGSRPACYAHLYGLNQTCQEMGLPCLIDAVKQSGNAEIREFTAGAGKNTRHVEIHAYPIFDVSGEVVQVIQYHHDITERKHTEAELQKRSDEMRTLYEAGTRLNATLNLETIFATLENIIPRLMPCDGLYIFTFDRHDQMIHALGGWEDGDRLDMADLHPIELDQDGWGPQSQVIRSGEALFLPNYPLYMDRQRLETHADPEGGEKSASTAAANMLPGSAIFIPIKLEGPVIGLLQVFSARPYAFTPDNLRILEALEPQVAAAIGNARLYEQVDRELQRRTQAERQLQKEIRRTRVMLENVYHLGSLTSLDELLENTARDTAAALQVKAADISLYDEETHSFTYHTGYGFPDGEEMQLLQAPRQIFDGLTSDWRMPVVLNGPEELQVLEHPSVLLENGIRSRASAVMVNDKKLLGLLSINASADRNAFSDEDLALLRGLADQTALGINLFSLLQETKEQASQLKLVYEAGLVLNSVLDLRAQLENLFRFAMQALDASHAEYWSLDPAGTDLTFEMGLGYQPEHLQTLESRHPPVLPGSGFLSEVLQRNEVLSIADVQEDERFIPVDPSVRSGMWAPVTRAGQKMGVLVVFSARPKAFRNNQDQMLALFANEAAVSIENARLFAETNERMNNLIALRRIDQAITSGMDIRLVLDVLLEQVLSRLKVDAASILVFNPQSHILEFGANRGFQTSALQHTFLSLGEGYAGKAAQEQRTVYIPDLRDQTDDLFNSPRFKSEGFISYFGVPLIAKGQANGVLEIFHRSPLKPDQEWQDFLEALARQAAISIETSRLYDNLQRANFDLTLAYDATLEGWARALDLRDRETEGHTQRVTQLTLTLGRAMNIKQPDLLQMRRGALLHDIGKMGVPDRILNKPGPLDEQEWKIMRRHPLFAYQMLSPIEFLRPALDIPYAHHERWDGSGYPRGLKHEEIPLSARIFAVVDVWDALRSDRPYRNAWPREQAVEYLRKHSDQYFDPNVVEAFISKVLEAA